jgi:hypothetical protein
MKVKKINEHGYEEALLGLSLNFDRDPTTMGDVLDKLSTQDDGENKRIRRLEKRLTLMLNHVTSILEYSKMFTEEEVKHILNIFIHVAERRVKSEVKRTLRLAGRIKKLPTGCIVVEGSEHDYFQVTINCKPILLHRLSLAISLGRELNKDEFACHKCDVVNCFNPEHLFTGSILDNNRDSAIKERRASGTKHHLHKLDEDTVRYIRSSTKGTRELGRELGVDKAAIACVRKFKTWKHVK